MVDFTAKPMYLMKITACSNFKESRNYIGIALCLRK